MRLRIRKERPVEEYAEEQLEEHFEERPPGLLRRIFRRRISKVLIFGGLLASAAFAGSSYLLGGTTAAQAQFTTLPITRGDLELTVEGSGTVQVGRSQEVPVTVGGKVEEVLVKSGQFVKAGQPLVRLDKSDSEMELKQAEADLVSANARLTQTIEGTTSPNDVASASASVRSAQANLQRTINGTTSQYDIANAEAAVRIAEIRLQEIRNGAKPEDIRAAQLRVEEARQNYNKAAASASANKTNAEQSMLQAADSLRLAQENYSRAYWDHQKALTGVNPQNGIPFDEQGLDPEIEQRKYEEALRDAELQVSQAESRLEQAKVAFETAKQQELLELEAARAQIDDAQAQLDTLLEGPDAADLAEAQAQLEQARASLNKLKEGGAPADIASAQAQLDQARANLAKLSEPAEQSDIEIAQASVLQAELKVEAARRKLEQTVVTAPFDGTITEVKSEAGTLISAGSAVATVVDTSTLYLNINLSESDITSVKVGQSVRISFDALPDVQLDGIVDSIGVTGSNDQGVVTYPVRIAFEPGTAPIRVGMSALAIIIAEVRENVLQVPNRALQSFGTQASLQVLYGENETPITLMVETGATNGSMTEIVSCLDTGNLCLNENDQVAFNTAPVDGSPAGAGPGRGPLIMDGPGNFSVESGGGSDGPEVFIMPAR